MNASLAKLLARLDPAQLEHVLVLYAQRKIGLAKGAAVLGIHLMEFQYLAGQRGIELAMTPDDLKSDVETLRRLGYLR